MKKIMEMAAAALAVTAVEIEVAEIVAEVAHVDPVVLVAVLVEEPVVHVDQAALAVTEVTGKAAAALAIEVAATVVLVGMRPDLVL